MAVSQSVRQGNYLKDFRSEYSLTIKILFFIETLDGGGAEKVLCNLVNSMDQSRFEITVQTLWKADSEQLLRPGIHYRYCYADRDKANVLRSRYEAALGLTYRLYIKDDYDIEVAFLEFGSTKIISRSTNRRAKKVAWVHSDLVQKLSEKEKTIQKVAQQYVSYDRIICVSESVRESFIRLFGREKDTFVLYNTVDDNAIRKNAELTQPDFPKKKRATAVTVGRLAPEKQYDMLLRVHRRLIEEGVLHDLWIVGEGSERGKLEAFISENQMESSVKLLGFQANPYTYMQNADFLVCSSRYEGLSTFVVEGLILGRPIITTECSGMRELLGDSEAGLIVENSETALLTGMRELLNNPSLRNDYAKQAKQRGDRLSAMHITKKTEQFFITLAEDVFIND